MRDGHFPCRTAAATAEGDVREATRRWLSDIRHHIAMAGGSAAGMTYAAFKDDNLRLYAVT